MRLSSLRLCWAISAFLTTAQAVYEFDTIRIGPYDVLNCKANNDNFVILINSLGQILQPVITDLGSSTAGDAYTTFFKNIAYAPYVLDVFVNITNGVSIPPKPGEPASTPKLVCVDAPNQFLTWENNVEIDIYFRCGSPDGLPALALVPTPYVVICPAFFTRPLLPVKSAASCLTVEPHFNRFVQNSGSLTMYQIWYILHELVRYYVYSTKGKSIDVYLINTCVRLPSRLTILNPQNYVYYVANIRLGCTNFPAVRTRPPGQGGGIEFLETDAIGSALAADESNAIVVQNVSLNAAPAVSTQGSL